jgi:hypothetical protein
MGACKGGGVVVMRSPERFLKKEMEEEGMDWKFSRAGTDSRPHASKDDGQNRLYGESSAA